MKRETFITCLQALLSEADDELLREAEGLVFWRRRELRAARVQELAPFLGQEVEYLARDGATRKRGTLDHLNKYSISVKIPSETAGYIVTVVPIERYLQVVNRSDAKQMIADDVYNNSFVGRNKPVEEEESEG